MGASLQVALFHDGGSSSTFPDKADVSGDSNLATGNTDNVGPKGGKGSCSGLALEDSLVEEVVTSLRHRCSVIGGDQVTPRESSFNNRNRSFSTPSCTTSALLPDTVLQ